MELRHLEYFMAVCKELHFTRAAESLNISQPSLSQQIKLLEHEVGMPLFDRIGKKTALTEAGRLLLVYAHRIFHEIEQAQAALNDLNGLQRGKLTIGALLTTVSYLLPPTIIKFNKLYPNIELAVHGLRTGDIRKGLLENTLDLGVMFLPVKDEELESVPLFNEELSLAVPVDFNIENNNSINLAELLNMRTILLPKNYYLRTLIDRYCQNFGFSLKPVLELTTMESIIHMVSEGIGVTILPRPYLENLYHHKIKIITIKNPTPNREIGIIYRKDKYMCATTQQFIAQLTEISTMIKSS